MFLSFFINTSYCVMLETLTLSAQVCMHVNSRTYSVVTCNRKTSFAKSIFRCTLYEETQRPFSLPFVKSTVKVGLYIARKSIQERTSEKSSSCPERLSPTQAVNQILMQSGPISMNYMIYGHFSGRLERCEVQPHLVSDSRHVIKKDINNGFNNKGAGEGGDLQSDI